MKITMKRFLAINVAMLAAFGVAATQASIQDGRPLVTASWCKKAPAIDGKMMAGEWDGTAQVTGFVDGNSQTFAKRQSAVRVMCDDTHLYLAFTSPVSDGASLVAQVKDRDGLVWLDDAIEIFLSPDGKAYYQVVGNSAGAVYDAKGTDATWDGRVQYASGVQAGSWVAEMSIPYASIGASRPADGETWRINLARDLKRPEEWSAWSASTQLHNIENFGYLTFRHAAPVVVMEDFVMSKDGKVSVKARVCGPASRAASVDATLAAASTRGAVFARTRHLNLAGGEAAPVEITADLVDTAARKVVFTVTDASSGEVLARALLSGSAPLVPSTVEMNFAPLEYQRTGWVQVDISRMKRPLSNPRAVVELVSADSGVLMAKTTMAAFKDGMGAASLNMAGVRPGKYRLIANITGTNGTGEIKKEIELVKPPDAWVGNKIGITNEVLPPWTPMELQGSGPVTVRCWGREYRFTKSAFPAQITTQGEPILSAPIRLIARQGGRALQAVDQSLQVVSSSSTEVRLSSKSMIGGFQLTTNVRMEYDGLMVFDFTLIPGVNTTLESLELEIPLKSANARYMHVTTAETLTGAGYVCGVTGAEPAWT